MEWKHNDSLLKKRFKVKQSFRKKLLSFGISHLFIVHLLACTSLLVCLMASHFFMTHSVPIYIIIIIIMSCRQHGYPWPSLANSPYHSSLLAGLQGYIPYPHIAAVCMFEQVVLLLIGHMQGFIGVHH